MRWEEKQGEKGLGIIELCCSFSVSAYSFCLNILSRVLWFSVSVHPSVPLPVIVSYFFALSGLKFRALVPGSSSLPQSYIPVFKFLLTVLFAGSLIHSFKRVHICAEGPVYHSMLMEVGGQLCENSFLLPLTYACVLGIEFGPPYFLNKHL